MAVTLRLTRIGQKKRPIYRIVAADKQCKRDGRFLEVVGTMNTLQNPPAITLKEDRVRHWVFVGALASDMVKSVIKKAIPGLIEDREAHQIKKIQAARKARKARAAKAAPAAKKATKK